jgi:hypothetical protein
LLFPPHLLEIFALIALATPQHKKSPSLHAAHFLSH